MIFCLEGCSGTGKTTQYRALETYLQSLGHRYRCIVEKEFEPFKSVVGRWYVERGPRAVLTLEEVKDFARARVETFKTHFSDPSFEVLLFDRFFYTSAVYQASASLSPEEIVAINKEVGVPTPTICFLLDANPELCYNRAQARNLLTGGHSLFSTSPEKINVIRERYFSLLSHCPEIQVIDTQRPVEQITQDLTKRILLSLTDS